MKTKNIKKRSSIKTSKQKNRTTSMIFNPNISWSEQLSVSRIIVRNLYQIQVNKELKDCLTTHLQGELDPDDTRTIHLAKDFFIWLNSQIPKTKKQLNEVDRADLLLAKKIVLDQAISQFANSGVAEEKVFSYIVAEKRKQRLPLANLEASHFANYLLDEILTPAESQKKYQTWLSQNMSHLEMP